MNEKIRKRKAWAENRKRCWVCGRKSYRGFPLETHEIERKSHGVQGAWMAMTNYFRACKLCHMEDLANMPHAQQLDYKLIYDRVHYNLEQWLKIRDPDMRAPNRVTQEEVDDEVKHLKAQGHPKWKS